MNAKPQSGIAIPVNRGAPMEPKGSTPLENGGTTSFPEINSTGWNDIFGLQKARGKRGISMQLASRPGGRAMCFPAIELPIYRQMQPLVATLAPKHLHRKRGATGPCFKSNQDANTCRVSEYACRDHNFRQAEPNHQIR